MLSERQKRKPEMPVTRSAKKEDFIGQSPLRLFCEDFFYYKNINASIDKCKSNE